MSGYNYNQEELNSLQDCFDELEEIGQREAERNGWNDDEKDSPLNITIKPEILDTSALAEDKTKDQFRPTKFSEYIGQSEAKETIEDYINGCKNFNDLFPHIFLSAPSGCFKENTKILMADYTTKNIQDIKYGDMVLGFDEYPIQKYHRRNLQPSMVTHLYKRESKGLVFLKSNKNSVWTTNEHPFLTYSITKKSNRFIEAKDLFAQHSFLNFPVTEINNDYKLGWLLGVILADGSIVKTRIYFYNKNKKLINRYKQYINDLYSLTLKEIIKENGVTQLSLTSKLISNHLNMLYKNILKSNLYPPDILRGILGGFFDGDGTVIKKNKLPQHIVMLNTNKQIIELLTIISNQLRFKTRLYTKTIKPKEVNHSGYYSKKNKMYNLHLYDLQRFYCECKPVSKIYYAQINGTQNLQKLLIKKIFRKQDFRNDKLDFTVYNLTTSSGTYIANGFPVHNCGKTVFANIIANMLNKKFIKCGATDLKSEQQLVDKIVECNGGTLLIDESHKLSSKLGTFLLPILEERLIAGKKIKPFVCIMATTHKGNLSENLSALIQRFLSIDLEHYNMDDLKQIIQQFAKKSYPNSTVNDDVLMDIVKNCKLTPRIAIKLLRHYIYTRSLEKVKRSNKIVCEGLTKTDIKVLKYLEEHKGVGKNSISKYLNVEPKTYEFEIEPYLILKEFISVGNRRKITPQGIQFLKEI